MISAMNCVPIYAVSCNSSQRLYTRDMTTTDQVFIIILCVLLSIFFLMCIAVVAVILKLLNSVRQVVEKAEGAVESVENAAEILRDTTGRLAFFKLVRNIIKLAQNQGKK